MEVIREDTQFYHADKLDGLGDWVCFKRLSWPSPFCLWTWLQLYTDCDRTVEQYKDDFYPRYFGSAGSAVRQYMDALEAAMHERTSPQNVEAVKKLAEMLDAINLATVPPEAAHRVKAVRLHHEYCVLLKEIFQAFIDGNAQRWQELEKPFRDFFEVTYRQELQSEIDIPPAWAYNWYDWVVKKPENRKYLVDSPALH
ncbi:MAG: hypothetical protein NTY53_22955 [Kiritimatiellaeota bacterium]|nr:hypothetical protein [Kiritimatiellota bacterium]